MAQAATNPALWALAGSALTGAVTLIGVAVTRRGSTYRDLVQRTWEKRTDVYLELMRWALDAGDGLEDLNGAPLSVTAVEAIEMNRDLEAPIQAFASDRVRNAMGRLRLTLFMLRTCIARPSDVEGDVDEWIREANNAASHLRSSIRAELARDTRRPPIYERLGTWRWWLRTRVRPWWMRFTRRLRIR